VGLSRARSRKRSGIHLAVTRRKETMRAVVGLILPGSLSNFEPACRRFGRVICQDAMRCRTGKAACAYMRPARRAAGGVRAIVFPAPASPHAQVAQPGLAPSTRQRRAQHILGRIQGRQGARQAGIGGRQARRGGRHTDIPVWPAAIWGSASTSGPGSPLDDHSRPRLLMWRHRLKTVEIGANPREQEQWGGASSVSNALPRWRLAPTS